MKNSKLLILAILLCSNCLLTNVSFAQYTKLLDFDSINGMNPIGNLISDGNYLYGMTFNGCHNDWGTIFKMKKDGSGYSKLHDFDSINGWGPSGGSLLSIGNYLYGTTAYGGTAGEGTIFKIMSDGTGFSKLFDFASVAKGSSPNGSLISDGTFLYGMTFFGGINNMGTIFKISPDGTGYTKLIDFTGITNGMNPIGTLFYDGSFLYGTTQIGGIDSLGVIFKIKTDGTGYTKLHDFKFLDGAATNSASSLFSDGTFLYGTTSYGGTDTLGTIFKIKKDGTNFSKLLDFNGKANGGNSSSDFISDGTFLYAMTVSGGLNNQGVIFKIKPDGTAYSKLYDFDSTSGVGTLGSLILDGTYLYGMMYAGGASNDGTVFKYEYCSTNCTTTNISDNNLETELNLFPNPSNGHFNLHLTKTEYVQIEIYNVLAECIYKYTGNSSTPLVTEVQIDLSSQQEGVYMVKLNTPAGITNKKLIIQK